METAEIWTNKVVSITAFKINLKNEDNSNRIESINLANYSLGIAKNDNARENRIENTK